MQDRKGIALHQLLAEETELLIRLNQVRRAIAILGKSETSAPPQRPQCRADLLREYLLDKPAGVRVKDVPAILKAMGHTSFAAHETINWLSPSQLPPEKRYFTKKKGIITLRPEFNSALHEPSNRSAKVDQSSTIEHGLHPEQYPWSGHSCADQRTGGDKREPTTNLTPAVIAPGDLVGSDRASDR